MDATTLDAPKASINIKLIAPFICAARDMFEKMLNTPVKIERPAVKAAPMPQYDVSAIIGFSGDVVGSVVVSFPQATALKAVAAFAGAEMAPDSPDFADAIGELTNMIAGGAKKDLGANARITCPSVIIGTGHMIARLRDVPCLAIPCASALGDFCIEVSIKQVAAAAVAA